MTPPFELFTLEVDFITKHPFELPPAPEGFSEHHYKEALERLLSGATILSATDWARSSNSKSFRPPSDKDREAVRRCVYATHLRIHEQILPDLFGDTPYYILSETLSDVRFACVSGKVKVIIAAATIAATLAAGVLGAAATSYFERPNHSTDCSVHISDPESVGHHFLSQLALENDALFDPNNTACVVLRQRLLHHSDVDPGAADGTYGDQTIGAEVAYAKRHGLKPERLAELYTHMAEGLTQEKPDPRGRNR